MIDEDDLFKRKFTWAFKDELLPRLKRRYRNFKQDDKFWNLIKRLKRNPQLCRTRYMDAKYNRGQQQVWYSPNILKEFDKVYEKSN